MDIFIHPNAFDDIIPSWKNKLKDIFYYFPRDLFRFFKRVLDYLPILWNDRDWDHAYLLRMIKFKISRHRRDMEGSYLNNKARYAKQMKTAEILLDRIIADNYYDMYEPALHRKWGEPSWDIVDGYLKIDYPNAKTPEEIERCRKERLELSKKEVSQQKQDIEYLCKIFNKYILHWWT